MAASAETADIKLRPSRPSDAPAITALRRAAAEDLTRRHGKGPWSSGGTEKGVLFDMRNSGLYAAVQGRRIVGSLRLAAKKPWAIDVNYFSACRKPLYLLSMVVAPELQRQGLGKACLAQAAELARAWPADAIRLDAFDAAAGAGGFYRKCGYRETGRVTYRRAPLIYFEMLLRELV